MTWYKRIFGFITVLLGVVVIILGLSCLSSGSKSQNEIDKNAEDKFNQNYDNFLINNIFEGAFSKEMDQECNKHSIPPLTDSQKLYIWQNFVEIDIANKIVFLKNHIFEENLVSPNYTDGDYVSETSTVAKHFNDITYQNIYIKIPLSTTGLPYLSKLPSLGFSIKSFSFSLMYIYSDINVKWVFVPDNIKVTLN